MVNTYFLVYTSYAESLELLTDEECGRLFKALLGYTRDGTLPENQGNEKFIFPQMKSQIDRDRQKYAEKCEKAKKSAMKRWNNADGYVRMQGDANNKENEKESESEKENKKENENTMESESNSESEKEQEAPPSPPPPSPSQPPTLREIEDFCRRRGLGINPKHFYDYYSERGWKTSAGKPVDDWYALAQVWHKSEEPLPPAKTAGKALNSSFDTDDFFQAALQRSMGDSGS